MHRPAALKSPAPVLGEKKKKKRKKEGREGEVLKNISPARRVSADSPCSVARIKVVVAVRSRRTVTVWSLLRQVASKIDDH